MRTLLALLLLLLVPLWPDPARAVGCASLEELVQRLHGLEPGTPVRFESIRGNPRQGVVESVTVAPDGKRILNLRTPDGQVVPLFVDQLNPATFRGPFDSLVEGSEFTVRSRRGNTYSGIYRGTIDAGGGQRMILLEEPGTGRIAQLDVSRLNESSVHVSAPPMPRAPPAPAPLAAAQLPNGSALSTTGDSAYVSFQAPGAEYRGSGRITRMWQEPGGLLRVEVEELNPVTGSRTVRELTAGELANTRVSANARANFAARGGARPVAPPAALEPPPVARPARPPTVTERAQNVRRLFPEGSPAETQTGVTANGRMSPRSGRLERFWNQMSDGDYARRAGRIFDDVSPTQLRPGRYTYLVTEDGAMSFGQIDNAWEFGVKHMHLARGRGVLAAGELEVLPGGALRYNVESGTYVVPLLERGVTEQSLVDRVGELFSREAGSGQVRAVGRDAILRPLANTMPSPQELAALCASAEFMMNRANFCP